MKIWFQNRRYKTKRRQLHQENTMPTSARKVAVKVLVKDDQIVYNREELVRPIIYPSIPIPGFHLYWPYHPFHIGWMKIQMFKLFHKYIAIKKKWDRFEGSSPLKTGSVIKSSQRRSWEVREEPLDAFATVYFCQGDFRYTEQLNVWIKMSDNRNVQTFYAN